MARHDPSIQRRQISLLIIFLCAALCLAQEGTLQQGATSPAFAADGLQSDDVSAITAGQPPGDLEIGEEIPIGSDSGKEIPSSKSVADAGDPTPGAVEYDETHASDEAVQSNATPDQATADVPLETTKDPEALKNEVSDHKNETAAFDQTSQKAPLQIGAFIDLLGPQLLSLEMLDATHAQLVPHHTNQALNGKKVVGLYFSADWCGPCRKFTPELTAFYNKMNERRGKKNEFEIVWVSRCRDVNSFGQYFTQMGKWMALPPEEAMGERGRMLGEKYGVKSIPSLVLLDDLGNVITRDARNKIPADKAGIGFPWRNPIANIYVTLLPRSVRMILNSQIHLFRDKMFQRVKRILGLQRRV